MLQIKLTLILLLQLFFHTLFAQDFVSSIEWILEDALDNELIDIDVPEIITPKHIKDAIGYYRDGEFRQSLVILEDYLSLDLPDGSTDYILFIVAESFRMLGMDKKAMNAYTECIDRFHGSDKVLPSYFRLLQYGYKLNNMILVDTIYNIYNEKYKLHPLYNSVLYVTGKHYFATERYGEAAELLLKVPPQSVRHFQSQFLSALSFIEIGNVDKALLILGYIRKKCHDVLIVTEANALIGDIYFGKEQFETAMSFYHTLTTKFNRYDYAQVKIARIYLHTKKYSKARSIARAYLNHKRKKEYFFEMTSILDRVYMEMGEMVKSAKIQRLVNEQNINARFSFELSEELSHIYSMIRRWRLIEYRALEVYDTDLIKDAQEGVKALENLKMKCREILVDIGVIDNKNEEVAGFAQQRYISLLRTDINRVKDRMTVWQSNDSSETADTSLNTGDHFDSLQIALIDLELEYSELKNEYLENGSAADRYAREMQAKYIDWAFLRYLEKKRNMAQYHKNLNHNKKRDFDNNELVDSTHIIDSTSLLANDEKKGYVGDVVVLFEAIDIDKMDKRISNSRDRLIEHILMLLDATPGNNYTPQLLMRLAELYFDEASDKFGNELIVFEQIIVSDSAAAPEYPEFDLSATINAYDKIITEYPQSFIAADALFYKALAFRKLEREEEAAKEFFVIINDYPKSEYFVEANMNLGSYYFTNPKLKGEKGYELAEEAYRRVLYYRDHPQFVYAVYHLGWCYYMQDKYDDAISVFKYLIEEVELDFDLKGSEDKQVLNPLMREEAIDYIAISFDEQNDLDGAVKFLSLIGNIDYAAKVFKRIAELREEDLDYSAAISIYKRLINEEFALSISAPDAAVSLIKLLEANNKHAEAMLERESFFKRYSTDTDWHKTLVKKAPERVLGADSLTISVGLYVADIVYRNAESSGKRELFEQSVELYNKIVEKYHKSSKASSALWNIAVIQDSRLFRKKEAYKNYIDYTNIESADSVQREHAALNAIAIAQLFLPPDSLVEVGMMDGAAVKVVEAGGNYLKHFPDGKSQSDVVLTIASVYFNRKMFSNAAKVYQIIVDKGTKTPHYYDASMLIAKCYFGNEAWVQSISTFKKVWSQTENPTQKAEAFTMLLQSEFLYARQMQDAKSFKNAVKAFVSLEQKYPGSEYADISLFNAAEVYEKMENINAANGIYFELFKRYPKSKLAPDALFNAASNYEKIEDNAKAAEAYELIANNYNDHAKSKDALFNVGFCYEKLGELEKMADANERYASLFPGEKDVEHMMLRSAQFYFKAEKFDKAKGLFKKYVSRYQSRGRSVEAYYMIAKCLLRENDLINANSAFDRAEDHHSDLRKTGGEGDLYYAAESAFEKGKLKKDVYEAISLAVDQKDIKEEQKRKTNTLIQAVEAFQRVVSYKSERMFEALYNIGQMYERYADAWLLQSSGKLDAISEAVAKKNIKLAAAKLIGRSYEPYLKIIDYSSKIDSLKPDQNHWVDKAKITIEDNHLRAAGFMRDAVSIMQNAPIPKEIQGEPLYLYQYKKQLLETLEPLKVALRSNWLSSYTVLSKYSFAKEGAKRCRQEFGRANYMIPREFDLLAENILASIDDLPDRMDEIEKEELIFQFEDMVFEIQDKALFGYEDALNFARDENLTQSEWYTKIVARLAHLSPETYGKDFFSTKSVTTNESWFFNTDTVRYWRDTDPFNDGWKQAYSQAGVVESGKSQYIWGNPTDSMVVLWYNFFIDGVPQSANICFASGGAYMLYINSKLISKDTLYSRSCLKIDSINGMNGVFKGGDNIIAVTATSPDSLNRGFAMTIRVLVDSSTHFTSKAIPPIVAVRTKAKIVKDIDSVIQNSVDSIYVDSIAVAQDTINVGDIQNRFNGLNQRMKLSNEAILNEQLNVKKLLIKNENMDKKIAEIQKEIISLKNTNKLKNGKK